MSLEEIVADTQIIVEILVFLAGLVAWIIKLSRHQAQIQLKVDTLWSYQIRRGTAETIHYGDRSLNSHLVVNDDVKKFFDPIVERIQSFYRHRGRRLDPTDLAVAIEITFGDDILEKVCIPHGISMDVALVVAMEVAKCGANRRRDDPPLDEGFR